MKNEIKEMCHKCKKYPAEYNQTYCEFCLGISNKDDYITNLQEEVNKLTAESTEWESKCYDLQEENERYKNIIEIMERYFELIIDLSFDYDGLNEVKSLKALIDELKNYASLGRVYNTTKPIYENNGKKYNILNEELKGE